MEPAFYNPPIYMSEQYISPDTVEQIKKAGSLLEVVEDFTALTKKGQTELVGECHACGSNAGLHIPTAKRKTLYKCFKCGDAGKYPIQYLMSQQKKTYREALEYIAGKYNIDLDEPKEKKPALTAKQKGLSFRDRQLQSSGLELSDVRYTLKADGVENVENYRYSIGTLDVYGEVGTGHDMILEYLTLEGAPLMYRDKRGSKKRYYRVRYKNPEAHDGIRYRSPAGSGSQLWIPNYIINLYARGAKFKTLYIIEGEKKADKLCKHDLPAVALQGIHNLSNDRMPDSFERILERFGCQNIVFLLDEDFKDLSLKNNKPVDNRPRSFFKSVYKFRNYFYGFIKGGRNLRIFFGAHKTNGKHKGIDDLFAAFPKMENKLVDELKSAVKGTDNETDFFELYDITNVTEYELKKHWHLHSIPSFLEYYKDVLKPLPEFKVGRIKRRYNPDEDKFELAQALLPIEQYWIPIYKKDTLAGYSFDYIQIEAFLRNRGIGNLENANGELELVHVQDRVIQPVDTSYIQKYVLEFTRNLDENSLAIGRFIKKGISQYLGAVQCALLPRVEVNYREPERSSQTFVFNNCFVEVRAQGIEISQDAGFDYWKKEIINHNFEAVDSLFSIERDGEAWKFKPTKLGAECELLQFIYNTSITYWRKNSERVPDGKGGVKIVRKDASLKACGVTEEDLQETADHFCSKIIAIGYLLHDFFDKSNPKAIVCMDLKESARGASEGGTGKSIFSKMFEYMAPIFEVDAALPNLSDDKFMFEGVDEQTRIVLLDDLRSDFDFKILFSKITGGVKVQRKGTTRIDAGYKKFILNLNGVLRGSSTSYRRRQYILGFTDYYNEDRNPADELGHNLFDDFTAEQWNLTYNFFVQCVQCYLQFGLKYSIPKAKLLRRRQREEMGESFLEWALMKFDDNPESWLNKHVNKEFMLEDLLRQFPSLRRYGMDVRKIKEKLQTFAAYMAFDYNLDKDGGRIKSGSKEYICISNENYDAVTAGGYKINSKDDELFVGERFS